MNERGDPPVKATTTSGRVLDALSKLGDANLTEVETEVGLSKSSVHNHLETLRQLGFVVKEDQRYRRSLRFFELGCSVRSGVPFYRVGKREVDRLARISGLAAGLTVFERGRGVCIYERTGQNVETPPVAEGRTVPLYCTAPGKAMLAQLPADDRRDAVDAASLDRHTDQTITSAAALREELDTAETRGLLSDREEWQTDLRGLAAGVVDPESGRVGSIFVLSPSESMSGKRFQQDVPGLIISSANQIRKALRESP
ncbi:MULTISPECIES: IclR family transcriptional regulator [Haloferax]|uniref:Transcriptional regulator KdgR n=1 Tax=Haloferax massiliensis TaxID=1476858 RepID=A0A0D6JUT4_9EURY|nr:MULTISPECIES: IclR family transcriptional regulator [Haloferax]MDS0243253.1 IclR family transcriptional regulator [Haloferax sp. S2CR25]MDS0446374.1 IclR family transcriptional regulator [Haloferax sp. S2CR25-2]CQR52448.1 Transcriptional regulator KdgR [Haloferax massiliensis]